MHEAHAQELLGEAIHRVLQTQPVGGAEDGCALAVALEDVQPEALLGDRNRLDEAVRLQRRNRRQVLRRADQQVHVDLALRLLVPEEEAANAERLLPVHPQVVQRHLQRHGAFAVHVAALHAAGQVPVHVGSFASGLRADGVGARSLSDDPTASRAEAASPCAGRGSWRGPRRLA